MVIFHFSHSSHISWFSWVQFSHSVMSDSLRPHELQHTRLPCPTPTPRAHPNSCPLSRWCHLTISSFVVPFSSCPQSFPTSVSFPMTRLFVSGAQRIRASASVLSMNIQGWCCESAAFSMPANLENSAVSKRLAKVSLHSNPKEQQCQRMLKLPHNSTHLTR